MALRDVFVRITGKEDVSKEASKAGGALKSLGAQAKSLFSSQLFQLASFAGVVQGLRKSVEAANELEASTRKLEGTSKITGVALETLQEISRRGQDAFKLNATTANDFSVELVKLAAKAGDVGKASAGLDAFLNLGAAKGLTASQTLTAVQQSILGIDEGTDKLFNKNPSVLYAEYAAAIGTTAGKLTDQQKAQALLNAAITDGGKVGGAYADYLNSTAGKQEQLTTQLKASAAELGKSLQPALLAILPLLTQLAKAFSWLVQQGQLLGVGLAYTFTQIPVTVARIKGETIELLGRMVQEASNFIPFFGEKVAALGTELVKEGRRQVAAAKSTSDDLLLAKKKSEDDILGVVQQSMASQITVATTGGGNVTKITAEELAKRKAAEEKTAKDLADAREKWNKETLAQLESLGKYLGKERDKQVGEAKASAELLAEQLQVNLGEATAKSLQLTTAAMEQLLVTLKGKIPVEQYQALNAAVQQHKRDLSDLLPPAEDLAESAKEAADANAKMAEELGKVKPDAAKVAGDSATLARGFLDAAQAAGVLDGNMASALTSVVNIAAALPKALAGDASSIVAVVSGLANIITGLKDNPAEIARREIIQKNVDALTKNTLELGNFNLGASGKTFNATQTALQAAQAAIKGLKPNTGQKETDRLVLGDTARRAFIASLIKSGVSPQDAFELLKSIGITGLAATGDPRDFLSGLGGAIDNLGQIEFGKFDPNNFEDQLKATENGFDIFGTTDEDAKLAAFRDLVARFSPALAGALNVDLSTPEGRAAATKNLQALFEKLRTGGLSAAEIGVTGTQFLSLLQTILPLLASADGVGATTAAAASVASRNPLGAPGLPTSTFGIGAPDIRGSVVPTPNTTTTINGGITITNTFPNATNADEISTKLFDQLDEYLGRRYDDIRAASGTLTQVGS